MFAKFHMGKGVNMIDLEPTEDPSAVATEQASLNEPFHFDDTGRIDPEFVSPIHYLGSFTERHIPEDETAKPAWYSTDADLNIIPEMMIPPEDEDHRYAKNSLGKPIVHAYMDRIMMPDRRRRRVLRIIP
jgi:hypothetical protein